VFKQLWKARLAWKKSNIFFDKCFLMLLITVLNRSNGIFLIPCLIVNVRKCKYLKTE